MKKRALALLCTITMTTALIGCGNSGVGSADGETQAVQENAAQETKEDTSEETGTQALAGEEIVLRLADVQAENDVETQFEYKFAELVSEKSGGRIKVEVYPAGQLGEMADILNSVQMGALEMCRTNPSWLADLGAESMNLLSLPFIFEDLESANRVLDGEVGDKILQELTDKSLGVHGLGYLQPSGRYFFFVDDEVSGLTDINNLKLRVPTNSLATSMVESLGASATPISYNELYSSLQTGIVDGADNPLKGILNMSFFEVSKYVLDMAHQYEASLILINDGFWNKLSEEDQKIIREAMDEAGAYYKEISDAELDGYRTALEEKGMIFVEPDNVKEWKDAVSPMYAEYSKGYEDLLQAIIDAQ